MGPRITFIGGGSYQWTPKLLVDIVNTPSLVDAEIVIEDIDPAPIPRMVELVEHIAKVRDIGITATGTTNQRTAVEGADYVVVCISTGALDSMACDVEIPMNYGIKQPVGDTVGPGGIVRALRNIPVMVGIARDMEELCPDAWLLNLTNPMTTLTRSVLRETRVRAVGLCHEIAMAGFTLASLFECDMRAVKFEISGVNHLPLITGCDVDGNDGLAMLADLLDREAEVRQEPIKFDLPDAAIGHEELIEMSKFTKSLIFDSNRVKLEIFRRTGILPGAGDRHLVEFFAGFLTEESGWGARWGVALTSMDDRRRDLGKHIEHFEAMLAADEVSRFPSGEMVAGLIDAQLRNKPREYPLNIANTGQVPDLPDGVVVESICTVDGSGIRGRDRASVPPVLADTLRRVSASQELTVEAALTGNRDTVVDAMLVDPLAGRIDYDAVPRMADEMLAATAQWLPQFA